MMIYPPIAELVKKAGSRYSLVIETAKRARQLSQGAPAFAECDSTKEVAVAANEIYEGKLSAVLPSQIEQHRSTTETPENMDIDAEIENVIGSDDDTEDDISEEVNEIVSEIEKIGDFEDDETGNTDIQE